MNTAPTTRSRSTWLQAGYLPPGKTKAMAFLIWRSFQVRRRTTYPERAGNFQKESTQDMQALDSHDYLAIGRLKPGVSASQGRTELSLIVKRLHDQHLDNPFVSKAANTRPLLEDMVGDIKTPLYVLLAATGCVLLIACLNVANLLVARAAARRRELAIRAALGGSRRRLIGEHLTESFLLSAAGGLAGLLLARAVIQWLLSTRQNINPIQAHKLYGAGRSLYRRFY